MQIVTVYLENDRERRRRSQKKNAFVILAASVIAVVALAGRTPPPVAPEQRAQTAAAVTTTQIVYVDRPILVYADPVGPPAPVPVVTPPVKTVSPGTKPIRQP